MRAKEGGSKIEASERAYCDRLEFDLRSNNGSMLINRGWGGSKGGREQN